MSYFFVSLLSDFPTEIVTEKNQWVIALACIIV